MFPIHIIILAGLLATPIAAVDRTRNPELVAKLRTAATNMDRMDLLPSNSDWVFDFHAQEYNTYSPGGVVNANAATFPATIGNGMTMAMLNLGPCAMLPPHFHPRASNYVVAVEGETNTFMIAENGVRVVRATLTPGKMTIFPKASLHTVQNTGCGNATLVSALNEEDTGTLNIVNGLFNLPADLVAAAFGAASGDFSVFNQTVPSVGTGAALGSAECLKSCNMIS